MGAPWFEVDKKGLAKTVERRGKAFVFYELLQNAFDEGAKTVTMIASPVEGKPLVDLVVTDDVPEGWKDLRHAYTVFAESFKKGDPTKAGKFDLGEKLVLALCDEASIVTTTGGILFEPGGRKNIKSKRKVGSEFNGFVRMTRAELSEAIAGCMLVIPPAGCTVTLNGEALKQRKAVAKFEASLQTEIADDTGVLRRVERKTEIEVFETLPGEVAHIYELGIPVVETGDKYHVVVHQRVPVSLERDNVPPPYLRKLRALVLNHTSDKLTSEEAASSWVTNATTDKAALPAAVGNVIKKRFGDKVATYDPSDPEANNVLVSKGYTILHGGSLPGETWTKVKEGGFAPPSGHLAPTKPDSFLACKTIEPETDGEKFIVEWFKVMGKELLGHKVKVRMIDETRVRDMANWNSSSKTITLNRGHLGNGFFNNGVTEEVIALAIHEFAHDFPGGDNHLSAAYYEACCTLGARLALRTNAGGSGWLTEIH